MDHNDDVGSFCKGLAIARHLVAAVAVVAVVLENLKTQAVTKSGRVVMTVIVDQNTNVDEVGKFGNRGLQRLLRVVGGHDDRDAFAVDHGGSVLVYPMRRKVMGLPVKIRDTRSTANASRSSCPPTTRRRRW